MLRLPPFRYHRPASVEEAAALLAGAGAAHGPTEQTVRLVAGGTDLWPNMKRRHQKAAEVVSLMAIPGLAGVDGNGAGEIRIGATTLLDDVAQDARISVRYPALATAIAAISSPPLRQMGTLGGNLCVDTRCTYYNQTEDWRRSIGYCMKAEGKICWVATSSPRCLAHTASDAAPMLCALGARVRLVSSAGDRVVPLESIYYDDGIRYLAKRPDEILTRVLLPEESDAAHCRSSFWKLRRRGSIDFAVLSAAAALWIDGGVITRARLFLGAVASFPTPAEEAEAFLTGKEPTPEVLAEAARLARKSATPFDNTDFQAQWRSTMVARYTEAALREAAGLDPGRLAPRHEMAVAGT
ncbi:MAG TPA: FAD binding domain-containing protein [Thermoanaerobaculia bacterium]|nr:FAD binding domain-containing protein [Thermoanaerobaculia bacterium]